MRPLPAATGAAGARPCSPAAPMPSASLRKKMRAASQGCLGIASATRLTALPSPRALPPEMQVAMLRHPSDALRGAAVHALCNLCAHPACAVGLVEAGCTLMDLAGLVESPDADVRRAANSLVRPLAHAELICGLSQEVERRRNQQVGGQAGGRGQASGRVLGRARLACLLRSGCHCCCKG